MAEEERSAGILVYRIIGGEIQVLLGKCGGPAWESRSSVGAWNIPKGHMEQTDSSAFFAALREFNEETSLGLSVSNCNDSIDLGESVTKTGKHVKIFAVEKNFIADDQFKVNIKSNMVETEWPKGSGKKIMVPELSEAYYFKISVAKRMIFSYQKCFLTRLEEELGKLGEVEDISEQIEGAATPGITVTSTFGDGDSCTDSIVPAKAKSSEDPGLTTSDIHTLYSLSKGKHYPVFRRVGSKKLGKRGKSSK